MAKNQEGMFGKQSITPYETTFEGGKFIKSVKPLDQFKAELDAELRKIVNVEYDGESSQYKITGMADPSLKGKARVSASLEGIAKMHELIANIYEAEALAKGQIYFDLGLDIKTGLQTEGKEATRQVFDGYFKIWHAKVKETFADKAGESFSFESSTQTSESDKKFPFEYKGTQLKLSQETGEVEQSTVIDIGEADGKNFYIDVTSGTGDKQGVIRGTEGVIYDSESQSLVSAGELPKDAVHEDINLVSQCIFNRTLDDLLMDSETGLGYSAREVQMFKADLDAKVAAIGTDELVTLANDCIEYFQTQMNADEPSKLDTLKSFMTSTGEKIAKGVNTLIEKGKQAAINDTFEDFKAWTSREPKETVFDKIKGKIDFSPLKMPPKADGQSIEAGIKLTVAEKIVKPFAEKIPIAAKALVENIKGAFINIPAVKNAVKSIFKDIKSVAVDNNLSMANQVEIMDKAYANGVTLMKFQKEASEKGIEAVNAATDICRDFKKVCATIGATGLREQINSMNISAQDKTALMTALEKATINLTESVSVIDKYVTRDQYSHLAQFPAEFDEKIGASNVSNRDYFDITSFNSTQAQYLDLMDSMSEYSSGLKMALGQVNNFCQVLDSIEEKYPGNTEIRALSQAVYGQDVTSKNFVTKMVMDIERYDGASRQLVNFESRNTETITQTLDERLRMTAQIAQTKELTSSVREQGGIFKAIIERSKTAFNEHYKAPVKETPAKSPAKVSKTPELSMG